LAKARLSAGPKIGLLFTSLLIRINNGILATRDDIGAGVYSADSRRDKYAPASARYVEGEELDDGDHGFEYIIVGHIPPG
jgi:hypothetical protein